MLLAEIAGAKADYSRLSCPPQGMKLIFPAAIALLQEAKTGMLGALK
jgi:hypothetical protein